ncbi:MAG: histidine--tRNA ligase [Chloracidobacterium sp.]|nr:histidine--tRNA ligase [Chloracidobacterium sp.]
MASTNPARGMRDFLPADVRKRNYVINIIKEVYESYGFEPLETPSVENLETLMGKYGDEGNQLVFKILKRGEKLDEALANGGNASVNERALSDLALRYDLTVPLARVVANNKNDLPKFFKRYQIQPVWRADRPAKGRFREFYQCDVDCIGSTSMVVEAEIISAACAILKELKFNNFIVKINDRQLIFDILDACGIESEQHGIALTAIDKLDKMSPDEVFGEIAAKGINDESVDRLRAIYHSVYNAWQGEVDVNGLVLQQCVPNGKDAEKSFNTKMRLHQIVDLVKGENVVVQPFLARGLSYYTGTIMEINVPDLAGSLGGGGRYDGLIGMFGKEQIPACGFSLGLERILVVMEERGMFPPEIAESTPADVMVTIWSDETVAESLKLANELRSQGLRVTLYPEADKLGKQMKYADTIKVPWVCVLGESEIAEGKVTLKEMETGGQKSFNRSELAANIKSS